MSQELVIIEHNNQRVMLTAQIAEFYEAAPARINENFSRNKKNFILGEDYFFLEGKELKQFKSDYPAICEVVNRAPHLYLWTEYGALMHAKSLQSDRALEVFRELRKAYFVVQQAKQKHQEQRHLPQFSFRYEERNYCNRERRFFGYFPALKLIDDICSQFKEDVVLFSDTSSPDISIGIELSKWVKEQSFYDVSLVKKRDLVVYVKNGYEVKRECAFYPLAWYASIWNWAATIYFPEKFPKYIAGKHKGILRVEDPQQRKRITERVNYFADGE